MGQRNEGTKFTVRGDEIMNTVDKLSDSELRRAYVVATKNYNQAYKAKKELEEEMFRRFEKELEENRK